MDTVLTTAGFSRAEFCNCPSVGTLRGYMQDAVAHDSGMLHFDPAGNHDASQHGVS